MDYLKSKSNLKGVVLALSMACVASNAFAVSLPDPPGGVKFQPRQRPSNR